MHQRSIIPSPTWSDGLVSHFPETRQHSRSSEYLELNKEELDYFLLQIGVKLRLVFTSLTSDFLSENVMFERLPVGFGVFWKEKNSDGSLAREYSIFGHPSGKPFLSLDDFTLHLKWLMTDMTRTRLNCLCSLCMKIAGIRPKSGVSVESFSEIEISKLSYQNNMHSQISSLQNSTSSKTPHYYIKVDKSIPAYHEQKSHWIGNTHKYSQFDPDHPLEYQPINRNKARALELPLSAAAFNASYSSGSVVSSVYNDNSLGSSSIRLDRTPTAAPVLCQDGRGLISHYDSSGHSSNVRSADLMKNTAYSSSSPINTRTVSQSSSVPHPSSIEPLRMQLNDESSQFQHPSQNNTNIVSTTTTRAPPKIAPKRIKHVPSSDLKSCTPGPSFSTNPSIFKGAEFHPYDLVWIPCMLILQEKRDFLSYQSANSDRVFETVSISALRSGFVYWPALIQDIHLAPFQSVWYSPLCIESSNDKFIHVTSPQICTNVEHTSIQYCYSVTLVKLSSPVKIIIAEEELKPFLLHRPPKEWCFATENDLYKINLLTNDIILHNFFGAYYSTMERATGAHVLSPKPTSALSFQEPMDMLVLGPEIFKPDDIVRIHAISPDPLQVDYFQIKEIIYTKHSSRVLLRGYFVKPQPALRMSSTAFYMAVSEEAWEHYASDVRIIKLAGSSSVPSYILFEFVALDDSKLLEISSEMCHGRFYKRHVHLGADIHIRVHSNVKIIAPSA